MSKQGMIIIAVILCVCVAIPIGIVISNVNKEAKYNIEVELEVINPHTGEVMGQGDTIPPVQGLVPIEIRVKNVKTGEYLTDDDVPANKLYHCFEIICEAMLTDGKYESLKELKKKDRYYWPSEENFEYFSQMKGFSMSITFDCQAKLYYKSDRKYEVTYKRINVFYEFGETNDEK